MAKSVIYEKSLNFSIRIVNLYKWLCNTKHELVLSKQLLRSGTSIGANIAEANGAISNADFTAKLYIAYKECKETLYWIELLFRTKYLDEKQYNSLIEDAIELEKLLTSITKTMRNKVSNS